MIETFSQQGAVGDQESGGISSRIVFFIFIPWSALGAFVRVKAHVMVRRPLRSVRHRTSRPPSYVLHIL